MRDQRGGSSSHHRPRRARKARRRTGGAWQTVALLALLWAPPRDAAAGQGERELHIGGGGDIGLSAAALDVGASWWWRDLFPLDAAASARWDATRGVRAGARLGLRAALDALTWCPWLGASAGGVWQPSAAAPLSLLVRAEAGAHYRPQRRWAAHLRVAWERDGDSASVWLLAGVSWFSGGAADLDF